MPARAKSSGDAVAYKAALAIKMSKALAEKYALYAQKKRMQVDRNRFQTTKKDSGRKQVYDAENATRCTFPELYHELTKPKVKAFFNRVVKSKTYQSLAASGGQTAPNLRFKETTNLNSHSHASSRGVSIHPIHGMTKYVVLHELAHTAGNMHHDLPFRNTLVKLVSRFLGVKIAKSLKQNFKRNKVKMSMKATIKTPEKWLEDYYRLEQMRMQM